VGFTTSADLDALFDTAAMQKDELSQQLQDLRAALQKQKTFAVDAPDGTSDAMRAENLKQVDQIITFAASHEDREAILEQHKRKIQGVEAPGKSGKRVVFTLEYYVLTFSLPGWFVRWNV
jgi:hypothetical protein